jgi:hypothetical protein
MIEQLMIGITGAIAIGMTQSRSVTLQRWACIVGLIGQPFWFIAAWKAGQWGVFVACCFYSLAWCGGFYRFWWKGEGAR